jgi:hypothetical protein
MLAGTLLIAGSRTAGAEEPPAPPPPPDPPTGAARVALGLRDPLRTSRFDVTASGPGPQGRDLDARFAEVRFALAPRWSFVDTSTDWAWVGARVGWRVETLLGSNEVSSSTHVVVDDVELHVAYSRTLALGEGGAQLLLGPRAGLAFPSSPASQASSIWFRGSLGLGVDLHAPLMHGDWLPGLLFSGSTSWEGNLAKYAASGPVSGSIAPAGIELMDQNQPFAPVAIPFGGQITATLGAWLGLYRGLSLGNTWGFAWQYYPSVTVSCPPPGSGLGMSCAGPSQGQATPHTTITIFDVTLGYSIADVVWIGLGYDNTATVLKGTGAPSQPSLFSSSSARFYGQVGVLVDGIYARAWSPPAPAP